jgi:hypothetical protein
VKDFGKVVSDKRNGFSFLVRSRHFLLDEPTTKKRNTFFLTMVLYTLMYVRSMATVYPAQSFSALIN